MSLPESWINSNGRQARRTSGLGSWYIFGDIQARFMYPMGRAWVGWAVTLVMGGFTAYTLVIIPHPFWMIAGAVLAALAGSFAAQKSVQYLRM